MNTRLSVNVNKIASLRNARGGNNPDIVNLVKKIEDFAWKNDCDSMELVARPGWEKVSKKWGWQKKHVQLEKWI